MKKHFVFGLIFVFCISFRSSRRWHTTESRRFRPTRSDPCAQRRPGNGDSCCRSRAPRASRVHGHRHPLARNRPYRGACALPCRLTSTELSRASAPPRGDSRATNYRRRHRSARLVGGTPRMLQGH